MTSLTQTDSRLEVLAKAFFAAVLTVVAYTVIGTDAIASVSTAVGNVKDQAVSIVPLLGTLAIIVIGISAMFGRVTWTQALVVAVGIAVASDAYNIYTTISNPR